MASSTAAHCTERRQHKTADGEARRDERADAFARQTLGQRALDRANVRDYEGRIDHGAALYFHHAWDNYQQRSGDPEPEVVKRARQAVKALPA